MVNLRLYLSLLRYSWRTQLQYRRSFLLQVGATALSCAVEFLAIAALLKKFNFIAGWDTADVAVLYGATNLAWSVAEILSKGIDDFRSVVRQGEVEAALMRPCPVLLQLLGRDVSFRRLGRFLQSAILAVWGMYHQSIRPDAIGWLLLTFSVFGTSLLFCGILVLQACTGFWNQPSELANMLTVGSVVSAQYPLFIYPRWIQATYIFLVPVGCTIFLPISNVLGKSGTWTWIGVCSPVVGALFLLLALLVWRFSLRTYMIRGS